MKWKQSGQQVTGYFTVTCATLEDAHDLTKKLNLLDELAEAAYQFTYGESEGESLIDIVRRETE